MANTASKINFKVSEDSFTPMEVFLKYLSYLPIFVLFLIISFSIAVSLIRYQIPIYSSSTRLFIKGDNDNRIGGSSRSTAGGGDLIESALSSSKKVNLDNEIVMITTLPLIQRVVENYHFNYYYYNDGLIRKTEIFGKELPFEVDALHWGDSTSYFNFYIDNLNENGGAIFLSKNEKKSTPHPFKWNEYININGNQFRLIPHTKKFGNDHYSFNFKPVDATAYEILGNLLVAPFNGKTTILQLQLKSPNLLKSTAELNGIVDEYIKINIDDKNKVLFNTVKFIGQRLELVTQELGYVETGLKNFQQSNQLVDIKAQSGEILSQKGGLEQQIVQLNIQQQILQSLIQQTNKMDQPQLIPANLGLSSGLNSLIEQYNLLVLKVQHEEPYLAKNSPVLTDLKTQLNNAFKNVQISLNEYGKNLDIQQEALEKRKNQYQGLVNEVPTQEKAYGEIKRQQNVKEGLYLYLLQKREETAISSSTNVSNYQQLEPAHGGSIPLSPNPSQYYTFALLFGILVPFSIIYIKELFNDKIKNRTDIIKKTNMPIVGEIGHVQNTESGLIVVDKSRSLIAEQFRVLRTNLNFMLQDKKTILVTSSMSGEGKSLTSLNLAAVLAISGAKVALLEFDLRKPLILKNIGHTTKNIGLSNYLAKQTDDLNGMYIQQEGYPHLHIYGCGPIPPNPAELMMGERIEKLFLELKKNYDFVIVDTAPVGLVSDPFNIMKFVDCSLYLIRQRKTLIKQLTYVNDLYNNGQLVNAGIIFNDVKLGGRYGYYGNNYGYGYGYGNKYAYSKKVYGNYFDNDKPKWRLFKKLFRKNK